MKTKQMVCPVCGNTEINGKMKKCPNCGAKLSKSIFKKWWFWVIVVVGVLIIGGTGTTSETETDQETNREIVTTAIRENTKIEDNTTQYIKVDIQQMLDELEQNALKAENTYNNAYIEVTGKIATFDSDGSYITIKPVTAGDWDFEYIMCYIKNSEQLDFLLEKSKGDQVTIKGKIISVGEVLGYSLKIDSIE